MAAGGYNKNRERQRLKQAARRRSGRARRPLSSYSAKADRDLLTEYRSLGRPRRGRKAQRFQQRADAARRRLDSRRRARERVRPAADFGPGPNAVTY